MSKNMIKYKKMIDNRGETMDNVTLLMWTYYIVAITLIVLILSLIQRTKQNKYKKKSESLEKEKNLITSIPVLTELSKIETILKNEKLEERFSNWHEQFDHIKSNKLPKVSDMILDLDYLIEQKNYQGADFKIAKVEIEIHKLKTKTNILLEEIREITLSEEKYRNIVTGLKTAYRELFQTFNKNKSDYAKIAKPIELQFENIDKRFQQFEEYMEHNDYDEVIHVVKALDDMINHMKVIIEEIPSILLLANNLIPKRMEEVEKLYNKMTKDGFSLEYLNVDYNTVETNKKINEIINKAKILNLEDSLFELKTLLDYYDSLFNDFEKEKISRNVFEEGIEIFKNKLNKTNKVVKDIFSQLEKIKNNYDLSNEDLEKLDNLNKSLTIINDNYKLLVESSKNKLFPYSKLNKDIEQLTISLKELEDNLDNLLKSIGNMHDDEIRAREQLDDVKALLNKAKIKIRSYKLPIIPNNYYIELKEAKAAIDEIVKELDKKPIVIKTLNIRVDTARDLVLKLYNTTNEMIKTAMLAEMAIVYGNRYKSNKLPVEQGLNNAEILFNKGDYKLSLETSINTIDLVEPGIYQRLLNAYSREKA
jgi:septation ring formation regulator